MAVKFYKFKETNTIFYLHSLNKLTDFYCENIEEIIPNTVETSKEKHIPTFEIKENIIKVSVGSVLHPMIDNHYISFVYLETKLGGQIKYLKPNEEPVVTFNIKDDEVVAIYEYCTLHGLWEKDL